MYTHAFQYNVDFGVHSTDFNYENKKFFLFSNRQQALDYLGLNKFDSERSLSINLPDIHYLNANHQVFDLRFSPNETNESNETLNESFESGEINLIEEDSDENEDNKKEEKPIKNSKRSRKNI